MATTYQRIKLATLAQSDLTTAGKLLPEQAARFIRTLRVTPTMLNLVRGVEMSAPQRNINKIQFTDPILKPATSNTALLEADRSKPATAKVTLETDELIAEVRLPYDVIEDNIERGEIGTYREGGRPQAGGGLVDTVLTLMAARAAEDLENFIINADSALGGTVLLGVTDGYLKLMDGSGGNIVDVGGVAISDTMFKNGMKTLPDQYLMNRSGLTHFISVDQEIEFRSKIAARATTLGDDAFGGLPPLLVYGIPVKAISYMPNTTGLFCNPNNLIWGVQRDIHLEMDKDIAARCLIIVLTIRAAVQIEELSAAIKYINIGV